MALLFMEGLDFFSSITDFYNSHPYVGEVAQSGNFEAFETIQGRFGGCALRTTGSNRSDTFQYYLSSNNTSSIWVSRAQRSTAATNSQNLYLFVARSNTGIEFSITLDTDGSIKAYRGDKATQLAATAAGTFARDSWNWIDIFYSANATTGIANVWLNNGQVLTLVGANTKQFGLISNNAITSVTICGEYSGGVTYNDDICINDTTGSSPWNTRIGNSKVVNLMPIADFGANSGTQSTGTTHFGVVDELPGNSTDWITIPNIADNRERFRINTTPLGVEASIVAVSVINNAKKTDVGRANLRSILINNTSGYVVNTNTQVLLTSYVPFNSLLVTNPETSAQWTYGQLVNTHVGVIVTN